MLARASLGRLLDDQRRVGGDDSPSVGLSGKSRKWIRHEFPERADEIKAAVAALNRLKKKPSKKAAQKAVRAISKIETSSIIDPVVNASVIGAGFAADTSRIDELFKAQKQLLFVLEQIEAFKAKAKREEDALVAILLNL